jgi:hypothetical protein
MTDQTAVNKQLTLKNARLKGVLIRATGAAASCAVWAGTQAAKGDQLADVGVAVSGDSFFLPLPEGGEAAPGGIWVEPTDCVATLYFALVGLDSGSV